VLLVWLSLRTWWVASDWIHISNTTLTHGHRRRRRRRRRRGGGVEDHGPSCEEEPGQGHTHTHTHETHTILKLINTVNWLASYLLR